MSQVTRTRGQYQYNRTQVLFLTGMTLEQYNNFQIDTAKAWVEFYFQNIMDTDALLATTSFWRWWMYQWNLIDDKVILNALYEIAKNKQHAYYRQLHQYVFEEGNSHQQYLKADFRHMRKDFEKEMKPAVVV